VGGCRGPANIGVLPASSGASENRASQVIGAGAIAARTVDKWLAAYKTTIDQFALPQKNGHEKVCQAT
jgi:hypothetical protein